MFKLLFYNLLVIVNLWITVRGTITFTLQELPFQSDTETYPSELA